MIILQNINKFMLFVDNLILLQDLILDYHNSSNLRKGNFFKTSLKIHISVYYNNSLFA